MAVTPEAKTVDSNEELVGAMGGIDENVSAENLSDVEWKEDDPLFKFNDENVTIPQTPIAALTPVQTESQVVSSLESPLGKKSCFQELIAVPSRQEQGLCPSLPKCSFQVGALATAIIKT